MRPSMRAGLAGVVAAAVAIGASEVVAVATGPGSAPLVAVGGVVVDHVPAPVKDFAIRAFGVHDKTALLTGILLLLGIYAYALGVLSRRRAMIGLAGIAAFAAIGVAAAVSRPGAGWPAAAPSLLGALAAALALRWLLRLGQQPRHMVEGRLAAVGDVIPDAGAPRAAASGSATPGGSLPKATAEASSSPTAAHAPAPAPAVPAPAASGPGAPAFAPGGSGQFSPAAKSGLDHRGAAAAGAGAGGAVVGGADAYSWGSRRRFLRGLGITAAAAAVGGVGGRLVNAGLAVRSARGDLVLPVAGDPAPGVPAGAQAPGAAPYVTPNRDFYRIDTALYSPRVDPATWRLRIHGMVRNPITISWAELLRRPMVERYVTLACVSNEVGGDLIGNARWLGVRVADLLDEVDPLPEADQVIQRSADGWTCGAPTAALRDGRDALLAIGMNGEPLPVAHGFPARMIVPGLYGYVSACKWITEIELGRFADFDAYWISRGWAAQAPVKTQSRIDSPRRGARRSAGPVVVAGVAWAQHRGIAKVEVQVDDGPWVAATLAPSVSADTWRQWSHRWEATPGRHVLRVRATDLEGVTQTPEQAPPAPDGATGWHEVTVSVE